MGLVLFRTEPCMTLCMLFLRLTAEAWEAQYPALFDLFKGVRDAPGSHELAVARSQVARAVKHVTHRREMICISFFSPFQEGSCWCVPGMVLQLFSFHRIACADMYMRNHETSVHPP